MPKFVADAAWLTIAGIAYNLGRWCGALAGASVPATTATLRRKLLATPGRLMHTDMYHKLEAAQMPAQHRDQQVHRTRRAARALTLAGQSPPLILVRTLPANTVRREGHFARQ